MPKKTKIKPKKQNNLVLIYGNQYTVDETIRRIRDQVNFDEIIRLDGESIDLIKLAESICYEDMFASKKLILIKEIPKEEASKFLGLLINIPSNNFVVFYSYSSLKAKKKVCKYFDDYGKLIEYDVEIKDIKKNISKIAESYGKTVSNEAMDIMSEHLGKNMGIINSEILKLCNYVGDRNEIEDSDVREICCLSEEFIIWNLIQQVGEKDIAKSIITLSSVIESGYTYEFIILMLMRSIRLGIFLRELDEDGLNIWDMTEKIKCYKKSNGSFVYQDYEIKKTYDARKSFFSSFSYWELCHSLKKCHDAFLNVRKAYKKEEQEKEVSMLLFAICFPSSFID